jgi:hypothetical protein
MSLNAWATIMPFGPVTNFLLAQKTFFGPAKGWLSFQALSIQNFYSHFTKVAHKCEYFGRIVEPCYLPLPTWIISLYIQIHPSPSEF